ncbi:MAG: substrate-binding domain-containing protein [Candidatus Bathyarchaeota archaeon]|nr:substrate-binding domain-containing protein [Candidatus Bathyarchaeota archaeon]
MVKTEGKGSMPRRKTLHVYSSGAVAPPVKKCAEEFKARFEGQFEFTVGKAENLILEITESREGDILTCGAEFILDDAQKRGLIFGDTRRSVGFRKSAILVPAGNPKRIKSVPDLAQEGVKVGISTSGCLLGVWDDISSKAGFTDEIRRNITDFADGCGAVMALINQKKVDGVFGWSAFKKLWTETTEVVELPKELQVYRSTGATVIKFSKNKELAKKFIDFLISERGKKVYREYGWYHTIP